MIDEKYARLRTHRGNIQRYRQLLASSLTDLENESLLPSALRKNSRPSKRSLRKTPATHTRPYSKATKGPATGRAIDK